MANTISQLLFTRKGRRNLPAFFLVLMRCSALCVKKMKARYTLGTPSTLHVATALYCKKLPGSLAGQERMSTMARPCHVAGCTAEIPAALVADGVCLNHFLEKVTERADRVRACFIESRPADPEIVDWLLGEARDAAQKLSATQTEATNHQILEILLCLANLQNYLAHHSVHMKQVH